MVSAFEVYLVMQLDSIGEFLGWASAICAFIASIPMIVGFAATLEKEEWGPRVHRTGRNWFVAGLCGLFIAALLPSTKTAAAMILVPALTSKEVVEPVAAEAKELYGLAKDALRELADREQEREAGKE